MVSDDPPRSGPGPPENFPRSNEERDCEPATDVELVSAYFVPGATVLVAYFDGPARREGRGADELAGGDRRARCSRGLREAPQAVAGSRRQTLRNAALSPGPAPLAADRLAAPARACMPRPSRSIARRCSSARSISIRARRTSIPSWASSWSVRFSLGKSKARLTAAFPPIHMKCAYPTVVGFIGSNIAGDELVRHHSEPGTNFWLRASVWFLSLLPIDWLL